MEGPAIKPVNINMGRRLFFARALTGLTAAGIGRAVLAGNELAVPKRMDGIEALDLLDAKNRISGRADVLVDELPSILTERMSAVASTGLPPVIQTPDADYYFWFGIHGTNEKDSPKTEQVPLAVLDKLLSRYSNLVYVPESIITSRHSREDLKAWFVSREPYDLLSNQMVGRLLSQETKDEMVKRQVQILYLDAISPELDEPKASETTPLSQRALFWGMPVIWGAAAGAIGTRRGFLEVMGISALGLFEGALNPFAASGINDRKEESPQAAEIREANQILRNSIFSCEFRSALIAYKLLRWTETNKAGDGKKPAFLLTFGTGHSEIKKYMAMGTAAVLQEIARMAKELKLVGLEGMQDLDLGFYYEPHDPEAKEVAVMPAKFPQIKKILRGN